MENGQPCENVQPVDGHQSEEDYPEAKIPEYRADVERKKKSGKYEQEYHIGQKVKVREKVGGVSRMITVTVHKAQETKRKGWEYQLKTASGPLFGNGAWVKEEDIRS
ncbi:uncharacterized protein BKCO1_5100052 [Diplodia corticola]|uniref:Uncharacterized protein n=1 Tax=Diplodia corticola TaxID=236234 RepID=A0A1J9RS12_9PEZI|nr:uncharacterized protein BKCO1_5100052 [Diplodia corticola]OJD31223.1 hypothetical protein BKCO1_5100052 [Diplodia corticola]